MSAQVERAWAEIDLSAISHNLALLRDGHTDKYVAPVIKADAYGHGAVEVARRLTADGVTMLAVASVGEGAQLREAGIEAGILLLGAYVPDECADIIEQTLTPSVSSVDFARAMDETAAARGCKAPVHIKIDTGMGRLGIPAARAIEAVERISVLPNLALEGIYTHFAESEAEDKSFTMHQLDEFRRIVAALKATGITFEYRHAANSAACIDIPEALFNCLRPGIALYGLRPAPSCGADLGLKPALKFSAVVRHIERHPRGQTVGYNRTHTLARDSVVAVVGAGYADGYDRRLSDRAVVTIRGRQAPVLGRVSMDLTSVDVTDIPEVEPGDEAVLFSKDPAAANCVDRLAETAGTIPYVLVCGISKRVKRIYRA
ncbi:MAG: alanine racemase [Planctomycetota bacterium]|jgi:alanine racemase